MEQTGYLTGAAGCRLFWRAWPAASAPRGRAVLVHGANEHSGRYGEVAAFLGRLGFEVVAYDQRGHGRSEGERGHVDRFEAYLEDLDRVVAAGPGAGRVPPGSPVLLVGHSMGGLVAFSYAAARPERVRALVLSGPWFALRMRVGWLERLLAPVGARWLPRLRRPAGIRPEDLSRDPAVARAYREDPLVGATVTARWFVECSRAARRAREGLAGELAVPVLFLLGEDDPIVDPEAARAVYRAVRHPCKALRSYPGRRHEVFNEWGREEVFADVAAWLDTLAWEAGG